MPYILYKSNGQRLAVIEDGSINKVTSDLTFVGKNYAGYGETLNQNLVKLLENFANTTQPPRPLTGQLFYSTSEKKLKVYDGSRFKPFVSLEVTESTRPLTSVKGDLWFNEFEQKLYVYNGTKHVLVGPFISEFTGVSLVPSLARTDNDLQKYILKFVISDEFGTSVPVVVARDEFIPNVADDLTVENFNIIKQGITLPGANPVTGDSTGKGHYFWGTAAHALRLGEFPAADYALQSFVTGLINTDGLFINNRNGINVFNGFRIAYDSGNKEGQLIGLFDTDKISFSVVYNGSTTTVYTINGNTLIPNIVVGTNLGTNLIRFSNFYFNTGTVTDLYNINAVVTNSTITNAAITNLAVSGTFTGNLTGNVTGNLTGNTFGIHQGNVRSLDAVTIIDANNRSIAAAGATINTVNVTSNLSAASANLTALLSTDATISNATITTATITTATITTVNQTTLYLSSLLATGGLSNSPGSITGNWTLTSGSRMQATYADLAERYHADNEYEPGTVLVVGGEFEVTISTNRSAKNIVGVVSTSPAFTMNDAAGDNKTHPYIALKGRIPCKVTGKIIKGDRLVSSNIPGYATAMNEFDDPSAIIGIALENSDQEINVIEIKV